MPWSDATIDFLFNRTWIGYALIGIVIIGILWIWLNWDEWKFQRERQRTEGPIIAELFLIHSLLVRGSIDNEVYEKLAAPLMEGLSPLTQLIVNAEMARDLAQAAEEFEIVAKYLLTKQEEGRIKAEEMKQEWMRETGMSGEEFEAIMEREETLRTKYPEFTE